MKKILLIIFILCFSVLKNAKAESDVHFIFFGGFNTTKLIGDFKDKDIIISEAKKNYNLGAGFRFEIGNVIYLQPEIYFTRKGGNLLSTVDIDTLEQKADYMSVDAPILLGIRFFHSDNFCIKAYGGPVISFIQDQNFDILKNKITIDKLKENSKIFSFQLGIGIDIRSFTFDVRYEWGATQIYSFEDLKTKSRTLYFRLGFKLF